jgi:hypothetical protein
MSEKERRIVSLPPGLWAEVEQVAGKRKVSEWITEEIEEKLTPRRHKALAARVAELEGRDGAE